jgi:transposase
LTKEKRKDIIEGMVSIEIRRLISTAAREGKSVAWMADAYKVPNRTIRGLLAHERRTGSMEPDTKKCGKKPALDGATLEQMKGLLKEKPDISLEEIKAEMGLEICISAIDKIINHKLKLRLKKKHYTRKSGIRRQG